MAVETCWNPVDSLALESQGPTLRFPLKLREINKPLRQFLLSSILWLR